MSHSFSPASLCFSSCLPHHLFVASFYIPPLFLPCFLTSFPPSFPPDVPLPPGKAVFLARDKHHLSDLSHLIRHDAPYLFQEYVKESHGRDVRVVLVGGRVIGSMLRCSTDGRMQSNCSLGKTELGRPELGRPGLGSWGGRSWGSWGGQIGRAHV